MLYLLRYPEGGRDVQRGRLRHDLCEVLSDRLRGCRLQSAPGRVIVESDDAEAEVHLAALHGIDSYSPAVRCELAELTACVLALAAGALAGRSSFAVRVQRTGAHPFRSQELAAKLGRQILARHPALAVDLAEPEVRIGVEVRAAVCFVFDTVVPGRDRRAAVAPAFEPRFLADQMLGTLAVWLRMLGFDTEYERDRADSFLLRQAELERRILLTRDRALALTGSPRVLFVAAAAVRDQLREVLSALGLPLDRAGMFTRCSLCNAPVEPVAREAVREQVPPIVYARYRDFTACTRCHKLYWPGEHYDRILATLADLLPAT